MKNRTVVFSSLKSFDQRRNFGIWGKERREEQWERVVRMEGEGGGEKDEL